MTMPVSKSEVAALLGVSANSIPRLVASGMPGPVAAGGGRGKASQYDAVACVAWQRAELVARHTAGGSPRDEYLRALTEKARLEIATRKAELIESAEVEREFADIAHNVKSRMRRIPDAVADRVLKLAGPGQVKALLLEAIDEALTELARGFTGAEAPEVSRPGEPGEDETDNTRR